jgi:hypothetical protein
MMEEGGSLYSKRGSRSMERETSCGLQGFSCAVQPEGPLCGCSTDDSEWPCEREVPGPRRRGEGVHHRSGTAPKLAKSTNTLPAK